MNEEKTKWNIGTACKKLVQWDRKDWIWIVLTIFIIVISYLYWIETKVAKMVYTNLPKTCEVYDSLKTKAIADSGNGEVDLYKIANETIQNLTHG